MLFGTEFAKPFLWGKHRRSGPFAARSALRRVPTPGRVRPGSATHPGIWNTGNNEQRDPTPGGDPLYRLIAVFTFLSCSASALRL